MNKQTTDTTTKLVNEAKRLGNHKTKRATIETALKEYIRYRKQQDIVKLFGTVDFDENYDYKAQRKKLRQ